VTIVVVDASVLVACAIADGKARHTLFAADSVDFVAPALIHEEYTRQVPKIIALSGVAPSVITALSEDLFDRVRAISVEVFLPHLTAATALVEAAKAQGDEDYVALAMALDAPIWSYDNDFRRIREVRLISRREIELLK
jgi:predicted nucleic acid-binding protein